ncbi:MAG: hypothetical protein KDA63_20435, partial [Planctomycetales bacterium]|nr:hypothetical protein [Planctomycetales bacterium]
IDGETKRAELIDEANKLMEERRFPEAEVIVKRAEELDPDHPVVAQLLKFTRLWRQNMNNRSIVTATEDGFLGAMNAVEESKIPFGNDNESSITFPNVEDWNDLTKSRFEMLKEQGRKRSPREIEIEQKLSEPVQLDFQQAPLAEVMSYLGELVGINIVLSPEGLAEEGVTTDSPVTIQLRTEVSLKSALNLILSQYHLGYVIRDEVLKITSEQAHDSNVYAQTYYVADLVMPIPNFVPSRDMGLAGAVRDAIGHAASLGFEGSLGFTSQAPMTTLASANGGAIDSGVLAQVNTGGSLPTIGGGLNQANGSGPGGLGGGVQADFDTLINLIQATIEPTTWDIVGGDGSIQRYPNNLSLVVSTTQEIHEQIVELLEQLRRLQDLQVTIEVRFITLNDNFFERIGVDFDFDIDDDIDKPFQVFGQPNPNFTPTYSRDGVPIDPGRDLQDRDHQPSAVVGRSSPDTFSLDLDIPFRQGSFGLAVPQFGGFDPTAGAQIGFAILSDLEAYFFVSAAQGDRRSNVLQAPKVTLFNGQQASVSDTSQSPFVISVIPVVGDFAAAQQPVIVVLSEGTHLSVQAVVSSDRRFVRLTVVPFFSQIGDVTTFQFTGSSTTTEDTSTSTGPTAGQMSDQTNTTTTNEGTTVQLPTFSFVSVTTTVSVPDGGTVLLGGVKRLSEGRNEFGVPILSKIPYINRLFSNVGIGRETQSLMMMVTPRIIIQEEEEELRGLATPN